MRTAYQQCMDRLKHHDWAAAIPCDGYLAMVSGSGRITSMPQLIGTMVASREFAEKHPPRGRET